MNSAETAVRNERRVLRCGSAKTADGPPPSIARQSVALCFTEGDHAGLALPARPFRRVDIPLLDGKVARIIEAADAARCISRDAVPLLAILAPGANRAVPLFRPHDPYTP
jgi:hypothetical protein